MAPGAVSHPQFHSWESVVPAPAAPSILHLYLEQFWIFSIEMLVGRLALMVTVVDVTAVLGTECCGKEQQRGAPRTPLPQHRWRKARLSQQQRGFRHDGIGLKGTRQTVRPAGGWDWG